MDDTPRPNEVAVTSNTADGKEVVDDRSTTPIEKAGNANDQEIEATRESGRDKFRSRK